MRKLGFFLLIVLGFLACKRSTSALQRNYDKQLIDTLKKLSHNYTNKKVRVNTWDKKADAYLDIQVLDQNNQIEDTLTIGDSVRFIKIDMGNPDGIRAKVKLQNNAIGYIPYWTIEEFEPAKSVDPDLKF